jgi:hypothetical protein
LTASEKLRGQRAGRWVLDHRVQVLATTAEAEVASYTVSLGTTRAAVARIADYVGVKTSEPFENTFALGTDPAGNTTATSFSYPTVTTTAGGEHRTGETERDRDLSRHHCRSR